MLLTRDQLKSMGLSDDFGARTGAKSIAIARFQNLGIEAAYAYFCTGLTDDLISALTKVPAFPGLLHGWADRPTRSRLTMRWRGAFGKQGRRLRIAAQLIDTANSLYIWSETYERDLSDAFAVQDEISRAIVAALRKEFQSTRS